MSSTDVNGDNGYPGNNDFFAIQLSNGYLASGNLTTGDLSVHSGRRRLAGG